jgi:hypothetical protein
MPQTGMSKIWDPTSQQVTSTELIADKLLDPKELKQIFQKTTLIIPCIVNASDNLIRKFNISNT